jgi:magnesium-transporting ATPase (P-type)
VTSALAGLTTEQAGRRLAEDGPNRLPAVRGPSALRALLAQMTHLLAMLLWVAAGLALLAGLPPLALAITVVVVLNGAFAFAQEYRADRAAERLRSLLPATSRVRRDGRLTVVDAAELVRGDAVVLRPGDRIAADLRLAVVHGLAVDESMLTGESLAVRHDVGELVLAGTFVVEGEAEASVEAAAADTRLAGIAALTKQAKRPPSPLTVELHRVVRTVAVLAAGVGTVLGLVALGLGLGGAEAFLFGVGVTVALVPEGMLPTVTLSLARGAQRMARANALVRRLDAVETLGATTFVCTDKTGTLTQNRMSVVEVWTPDGSVEVDGQGYRPDAGVTGPAAAVCRAAEAAGSAVRCVHGRAVQRDGVWVADGDPMEVALDVLAHRLDAQPPAGEQVRARLPYTAARMRSSVVVGDTGHVLGAPESVLAQCVAQSVGECAADTAAAAGALADLTARGRRVVAVAQRPHADTDRGIDGVETGLRLIALLGLEDPPRHDVAEALQACRRAGVRVAMVTGDHPSTAAAIAKEVGLLSAGGPVVEGADLPADDHELAALLDRPTGAVVARVTPGDKLRIAGALREHGHVVAMTGDGVNDAPALREADVGVAMGASGSDVAREAADLVLLDDHFATIVSAIELGRATFTNVRRFLTYHLTDNVAELAPFAVWALTAGQVPLAISVLQVLALDIATDMLPALALGAEPPSPRTLEGPARSRSVVDTALLSRALGVLGPTEAIASMTAFMVVLVSAGWEFGATPSPALLAVASGTAFAVIALSQMANAYACRSETRPAWDVPPQTNRLVAFAVVAELVLLTMLLAVPRLADLLGGSWPAPTGWAMGVAAAGLLLAVDAAHKRVRRRQWLR